ncbi:MAG: CehA/McbA family metallohydrolase domain-containing protein [Planctomycetota bacterium]|jgi:hypothetical protein
MSNDRNRRGFNRRDLLKSSFCGLSGLILTSQLSGFALAEEAKQTGLNLNHHQLISDMYDHGAAMASNAKGKVWIAALRQLDNGTQQIIMSEFNSKWSKFRPITKEGSYESPKIACAKNGTPMIVWSQEEDNKWTIQSAELKGGIFNKRRCAVDSHGRATNPVITAAGKNEYWLGWESYEKGKFKICLKQFCKGKWGKAINITDGTTNAYYPTITIGPDDNVWIAYSEVDGTHCNIKLTHYDTNKLRVGNVVDVAVGGSFENVPNINSHPDICFDKDGVLWITYETRGNIEKQDKDEIHKKNPCFFGSRHCMVVCYKDNKIQQITGKNHELFNASNDQLPTFVKDADDRLWIFTRSAAPRSKNRRPRTRKWNIRASRLESDGWSEPVKIFNGIPSGRGERAAAAIAEKNKFWLVWQNDNWPISTKEIRKNEIQTDSYNSELYLAELSIPAAGKSKPSFKLSPAQIEKKHSSNIGRPRVARRKIRLGNEEYTLLFGNLHEHTDLSRCPPPGVEGNFDENYRYGMDVEGYDFVGLADHGYDFDLHKWSRNRRAVRFYNSPPYFVALPVFEWTLSCGTMGVRDHLPLGSGHRNLVFASDKDAAKFISESGVFYHCFYHESNRIDKVWDILKEKDIRAVTIPHHSADKVHPACWKFNNPDYEMVVEMFQLRGSSEYKGCPSWIHNFSRSQGSTDFEGCYVQDALAKGRKLGFIASGDHNHMGTGLAALFVKDVSQEGIYEALKSRRCYGTTGDKIFMDFRINGRFMGEEITSGKPPVISAVVDSVEPLKNIVIFKNNNVIYELNENKLKNLKQYTIDYTDKEFTNDSYYYLRVIQQNDEIGWASPIWVKKV